MRTTAQAPAWRRLISDGVGGARMFVGHHLLRLFKTEFVSAIGGRSARFAVPRFHPGADRRARSTLRTLRPDLASDPRSLDGVMARYWDGIGRIYTEFSAEDRLWAEGRVTVRGAEYLDEARAAGRAIIVAGLHLANWEVLPISFGYLGYRFVQIYQPLDNRFESAIALATRLRANRRVEAATAGLGGCRMLPPSVNAAALLLKALKAGESFMIFVDEAVAGNVRAPAFGRSGRNDGNLARVVRLARLSGAVVVPAYVTREPDANFIVHYEPPIPVATTGHRDADDDINIQTLNGAVESIVRNHISEWYMLMKLRMNG